MMDIKKLFSTIADERHEGYIKHQLCDVLILVMSAVICGVTELADMMVYFENKLEFYKTQFGIEKYPSKPTLSRILSMVNGEEVGKIIVEIMRNKTENLGDIIAVDGKEIRSTGKKGKPHSFLQIVTAYATESGVTLGQESISYEDKTNEIPVFQHMLEYLDVNKKTIIADAMHCQKETCKIIKDKGGDYVFGLKANQKTFYEEVKFFLDDPINSENMFKFETIEQNGGRIEKRICYASENINWLSDLHLWSGLKTIFAIERITSIQGKITNETG